MWDWVTKSHELILGREPFVIVTVSQVLGSAPREVGAKMIVLPDRTFYGTIGGGQLERLALEDGQKILINKELSQSRRYPLGAKAAQCCGGVVELLFEVVNQQPDLYLFGAGHVGQAISQTLSGTAFKVHLIDDRSEWVHSPEVPTSTVRHCTNWEDFVAEADWDPQRTYVAILTHRHDLDEEILKDVLGRARRYVGLIGSKAKWKRFESRLKGRGVPEQDIQSVRCPFGLFVGGKSPKEIAISFAAEILQTHYA